MMRRGGKQTNCPQHLLISGCVGLQPKTLTVIKPAEVYKWQSFTVSIKAHQKTRWSQQVKLKCKIYLINIMGKKLGMNAVVMFNPWALTGSRLYSIYIYMYIYFHICHICLYVPSKQLHKGLKMSVIGPSLQMS